MVISSTVKAPENRELLDYTFASRYAQQPLPKYKMPQNSTPKDAAYQIIQDELLLDGKPRLNVASFVTTWMEPECHKLIMASLNKNYADMDEYPITTELQNRCVNMIAHLYHAPIGEDEAAVGVGTVGSSEAIMLAGLAFKRKWQIKRKLGGKPYGKPNIVTGANVQVCWEKFARYFEVELKEVKLNEGCYVMDPKKAVELVDENTICVAAILGSTLTGEFEDVKLLNKLLAEKNKETGWDTPIHVDAASGGFIAPFLYPNLEWDFRLPLVKSINVSGHKYGLVYAGVGWVVWRSKDDLPEDLIFHVNYLGCDQPTFTLNFSKGSSQIIAQYYQFIRLGFEGYKNVMANCMESARVLKEGILKTGRFNILSKDIGVPVVAISLKDSSQYTVFEISDHLRRFGWIVPAYTMPPDVQHLAVLRVVIREDFGRSLAERLVSDICRVFNELDMLSGPLPIKAAIANGSHHHKAMKSEMETRAEVVSLWNRFMKGLEEHNGELHEERKNIEGRTRENRSVQQFVQGYKSARPASTSRYQTISKGLISGLFRPTRWRRMCSNLRRRTFGWCSGGIQPEPREETVSDIDKVIKLLDTLPSSISTKAAHLSAIANESDHHKVKKSETERIVEGRKTGVC